MNIDMLFQMMFFGLFCMSVQIAYRNPLLIIVFMFLLFVVVVFKEKPETEEIKDKGGLNDKSMFMGRRYT